MDDAGCNLSKLSIQEVETDEDINIISNNNPNISDIIDDSIETTYAVDYTEIDTNVVNEYGIKDYKKNENNNKFIKEEVTFNIPNIPNILNIPTKTNKNCEKSTKHDLKLKLLTENFMNNNDTIYDEDKYEDKYKVKKIVKIYNNLEKFIKKKPNLPKLLTYLPWEPLKNELELNKFLSNKQHIDTFNRKYKMDKNFILKCLNNYKLLDLNPEDVKLIKNKYFGNIIEKTFKERIIDNERIDNEQIKEGIEKERIDNELIKEGIDKKGNDKEGIDIERIDIERIDIEGIDKEGIDKEGIDQKRIDQKRNFDNERNDCNIDYDYNIDLYDDDILLDDDDTIEPTHEKQKNIKTEIIETTQNKFTFSNYSSSYIDKKHNELKNIRLRIIDQKAKIEALLFNNNVCDIIDKKVTIVSFFKKHDIILDKDFFDIRDENHDFIIDNQTIDIWYNKIKKIEIRKNNVFDPSVFLLIGFLWIIEWGASKFKIEELKDLTKNINIDNLPTELLNVKDCMDECIFNKIPKNPFFDLFFYIGGYYINNKTGVNVLRIFNK